MDHNDDLDHDPDLDLDGSIILEQLALINAVSEFFDAVDADDFGRARALLRKAGIALDDIKIVLKMMRDGHQDF